MALKAKTRVFTLYKGDNYFDEGTMDELAESADLSLSAIKRLATPSGENSQTWTLLEVSELCDYFVDKDDVDYDRLQSLIDTYEYKVREIGEVLDLSGGQVYQKLSQRSRFSENELAELEDLFYLEKGELYK